MDQTVLWIILAVLVLAAGAGAWFFLQRRRSQRLRARFGPEYERVVQEIGDQRRAEARLEAREKRLAKLEIRSLSPEDRARFSDAWSAIQKRFVDSPEESVSQADRLVRDVMVARGYPMEDFEKRAEDISVHYPHVVSNYRAARAIAERSRQRQANTEELRKAVVYYRDLFEELLETHEPVKARAV